MKKLVLLYLLVFLIKDLVISQGSAITADILRQVYIIETESSQGSCFLVEYQNKEYIITAKHLFKNDLKCGDSTNIKITHEKKTYLLTVIYLIHSDTTIDIAVLKLRKSIKVITPLPFEGEVMNGQNIYFLGYPSFDNHIFSTYTDNFGRLPLVKKGIISGFFKINNYIRYYIDGHNNPGFSGGPALSYDFKRKRYYIFGVVSSYFYEPKLLWVNDSLNKKISKVDSLSFIKENSGIMYCYPAILARDIIQNYSTKK